MKIVVLLAVLTVASAQRYYGSYGQSGSGFGSGFGSGGPIVFPDHEPVINRPIRPTGIIQPVRPGGIVRPGQPAGIVRPGQQAGIVRPGQQVGIVRPGQQVGIVRPGQQAGISAVGGTCGPYNTVVHASLRGSEYHFSWCADGGQKYDYFEANKYCSRLGGDWYGVSIEDRAENQFVKQTVAAHQLTYIWTSGQRSGYNWVWASGNPFVPLDWSHTGFDGQPQPDNRENNAENCLAVLNNFYQDGVRWHDIACHHTKPIICERRANTYG